MNSRILLRIGKTAYVKELKREVTILKQKTFFVDDINKDYHTESGIISKNDLKKGGKIKSSKGKDFVCYEPTFIDIYKRIERGAQIIPLKDIGSIITLTGIGKDSKIVDAGSGSGALSLFMAHIAKKVTTYEIREDHYNIVNKNIAKLGLKNITIKLKNIYEGIDEKKVDVITLDLPEPWEALDSVNKALKIGGFVVFYNPSIVQISDVIEKVKEREELELFKIIEVIERQWDVKGRKVRPKTQGIGHSGFLCFMRKIQ